MNYEDRVNLPIEELKRGNISLQEMLKNISRPITDVGDYLCQVTREGRTEEITLSLKQASGNETSQQTTTWILNNRAWTDKERIKMTDSALLAVFSALEKSQGPQTDRQVDESNEVSETLSGCPEKNKKDNNAPVQQKSIIVENKETKTEEKDSQQENTQQESTKQSESTAMETSPSQTDDKDNLGSKPSDYAAMKTSQSQPDDTEDKDNPGDPLQKCSENKDYNKKDNNSPVQQTSIKVIHKYAKPEEKDLRQENTQQESTAMETSPSKTDDEDNLPSTQPGCSDQGQSQSHKVVKESQELQTKKPKKEKKGGTVFSILAGKINDIHKKFIVHLQGRIEDLTEAQRVEDSDVVLIFCPIVSRAGTDIDAALAKIDYAPGSKLTVLVVLHHTFDPEKTISNSSKSVNIENLLTVDCLFYEDTGLLDCQRNSDALEESVNWLIEQGHTISSSFQGKPHGYRDYLYWLQSSIKEKISFSL